MEARQPSRPKSLGRHLGVTDLEIAVLVDENVGWLEVSVDDSSRVHVLEPTLEGGGRSDATMFSYDSSIGGRFRTP